MIKKYPMQTQKEVALFDSAIDIFWFPTYRKSDSLGLVGLEAMACGCIVIASNMAVCASSTSAIAAAMIAITAPIGVTPLSLLLFVRLSLKI